MGKKRLLDSKIRKSQSFAGLTYRQRDLWQGIITMADDQGRMPGTPAFIRSSVWPYDDITLKDVSDDLQSLADCGYITIYVVDGESYIQVIKWWCYQNLQWASPSDHPAPAGWVDRCRYHASGNKIITKSWDSKGGYNCLPSELPSKLPTPIESVNVNGNVNDDVQKTTLYEELLNAYNKSTQTDPPLNRPKTMDKYHATLAAWSKKEVTPDMITEAMKRAKSGPKKYTISGPWSLDSFVNNIIMERETSTSPYREATAEEMI